jgi:hypothetical protein
VRARLGDDVITEDLPMWLCVWLGIPHTVTSASRNTLEIGMREQLSVQLSNIKFHENPFNGF